MMGSCMVTNCDNNKRVHPELSFFKIPNNREIAQKWIEFSGRKDVDPSKSYTICSEHFPPEQFKSIHPRKLLCIGSVPSINGPHANEIAGNNENECYNEIEIVELNDIMKTEADTNQEDYPSLPCQTDQYTPSQIDEPKTREIQEEKPKIASSLKTTENKSRRFLCETRKTSRLNNGKRQFWKMYREKEKALIIKEQERRRLYERDKINLLHQKNVLLEKILDKLEVMNGKIN